MIHPNELMLGNYVMHNNKLGKVYLLEFVRDPLVEKIWVCGENFDDRTEYGFIKDIAPVLLSPTILEKCNRPQLKQIDFVLLNVINDAGGWWFGIEGTQRKIEYLHQLQNLYFTLTGEELEINL